MTVTTLEAACHDDMTAYIKGLEGSRHSESLRGWLFQLAHSSDTSMSTLTVSVASHLDSDLQDSLFIAGNTTPGLPWWLRGRESACQARDVNSVPELGRSSREGNGNPLQYSCLGNPTDRGAWQSTVHGVTKELAMTQ